MSVIFTDASPPGLVEADPAVLLAAGLAGAADALAAPAGEEAAGLAGAELGGAAALDAGALEGAAPPPQAASNPNSPRPAVRMNWRRDGCSTNILLSEV